MSEIPNPAWRTSRYSQDPGGQCVEVANAADEVLVRDTKDRSRGMLAITPAAWRAFADQVKSAH